MCDYKTFFLYSILGGVKTNGFEIMFFFFSPWVKFFIRKSPQKFHAVFKLVNLLSYITIKTYCADHVLFRLLTVSQKFLKKW